MAYDEDDSIRRNRNHSWWKQRTTLERRGVILLIIALLIIIGLIIGIALVSKKNKKSENGNDSVCLSQGCVKAASDVLTKIDPSVDPCDDFYEFACGGFKKQTEIPADKPAVNSFSILQDVVQKQLKEMLEEPIKTNEIKSFTLPKKLYNACMNTTVIEKENLTTIKQFFKDVGGWPISDGLNWDEADFDWKKLMQRVRMQGGSVDSFIGIGAGIDPVNSSKRILIIGQGVFNVDKDNLLEGLDDEVVDAYHKYSVDLAVFFGATRQFAEFEVRNMINFVIELAKISLSDAQRRDLKVLSRIMTVDDLQKKYPAVPWLELINNIIGRPDKSITNTSETVNVLASDSYLSNLPNLLGRTAKRDQANYALFQILYSKVRYLPDYVRDREQQFNAVFSGTTMRPPRWSECAGLTSNKLGIAVGALYARRYFQEDARQNAKEMIMDVRSSFVDLVKKLDWMDEATRKTAIEKALSITNHIGYPDEFLDDKKLDDYYADLNFTSGVYLKMINDITTFVMNKGLADLRDAINTTDWRTRMATIEINAQYLPQENSIELPAGILQGVFFNKDRPRYMNYGGISYIIGHEITHGFDGQGKQYDKEGNVFNWWAEDTNNAYADKAKCIIDQYSAITVPELQINLNGQNTMDENIADNGGIKEAYLGYDAWVGRNGAEPTLPGLNFTSKQMFWISSAQCWCSKERKAYLQSLVTSDEHSPNRFRILVPFGNNDYFAKDFNCPVGSKMNPKHKCKVW